MFKSTDSRTSTTNKSEYNSTNISNDNRVAADNGAIVTRGNVYKTVTDAGAIRMAGEVSEAAIDAGVLFARMGAEVGEDGLRTGERIASSGMSYGAELAGYGRGLADEGFDLARNSMGSTIETLTAVIDRDREESAMLSEQLVNMIPYIVVGVVAWGVLK